MKVLICGDVHLGAGYSFGSPEKETGINTRLLDYEKTLSDIVINAINSSIDLFIFLGDIFETRSPSAQQIVVFYKQIKKLSDAGIPVFIIMGNHDYIRTRKITSSLDPLKEIDMPNVSVFTDIKLFNFINKKAEKLNIILMPYRNRQSYDKILNEEAIVEMRKEIYAQQSLAFPGVPIILVGHMMLENTISSDSGEYGINELVLPFDMFDGIDVVVNGHIHRSSILRQRAPLCIYSGSMECKDFSEKTHKKCYLIYDSSKSDIDSITFCPIQTRKFIDLEIDYSLEIPDRPMLEILKYINSENIQDSVVRVSIKVPETKVMLIDISQIRLELYKLNVNCISDISILPILSKQLRNHKVSEAPDDISAFKHYVLGQSNVEDTVLSMGISIINEYEEQ